MPARPARRCGVFRRRDVAQVRVVSKPGDAPLLLDIVHVDLYFFLNIDLVLLNVEVSASDLPLAQAQDLLYRFGRAYPAGWDAMGRALHCMDSVEFLDAAGAVLARSDAQDRDAFLAHVAEHRAPRIAAHWAFMLEPLVSDHSGRARRAALPPDRVLPHADHGLPGGGRAARADAQRLRAPGPAHRRAGGRQRRRCCPLPSRSWPSSKQRHCYDRFWSDAGAAPNTRYLCSGHSLVVVGDARAHFYNCAERGVLAQFRHQHFLLFLIAHFQKAALLMFSDRLAEALKHLDIADPDSIRRFKRAIRESFAGFLGFTHRYWFHEVSEQAQARALFRMSTAHLGTDALYAEVKERIADMSGYLEADSLRRQANTVVRLTVVTIFGLIGTVTTGFLGMNLLAEADAPLAQRLVLFGVVFVATAALTVYTMAKSKRLSDFLDALSDDRLGVWNKVKAFLAVWRREGDE